MIILLIWMLDFFKEYDFKNMFSPQFKLKIKMPFLTRTLKEKNKQKLNN